MSKVFLVMAGGSLGALCRYGTSLLAVRLFGAGFPWGTFIVNMVGCLLIGFAFALAERSSLMGPSARLFFVTGFLGALTTFSTYAMETVSAVNTGLALMAAMNFLANNLVGVALVIAGLWLGRLV